MQSYRQRAWAEISLDALAENVSLIQKQLSENTQYCAVVKADAYGHGEELICRKLYDLGIRFYAVSSFEEAIRVRRWCPDGEILILGYTAPECAPVLAEQNIIQTILSEEYALELESYLQGNSKLKCHIKLDTGMGRIGLPAKSAQERQDTVEIMQKIHALEHLEIEGIFTHFAVADEPDPQNIAYTARQRRSIIRTAQMLQEKNISLQHVHFLNSAGICYHNNPKSTLARAGLIMYGLMPNAALAVPIPVRPVLSLYSRISHIKTVQPSDCISYGRTYKAETTRKIATVTIGYADGYPRVLSNRADVLVKGIRCPIAGRVCMDQMMIDISEIPENIPIQSGDIVTLIGQDDSESITADELAGICDTIGYEIVCGISKRIPRIFKEKSRIIHEDHLI